LGRIIIEEFAKAGSDVIILFDVSVEKFANICAGAFATKGLHGLAITTCVTDHL
jgi:hypothetical protein